MNIVGLIQARMGSTRLPGKVMLNLAGKPVVAHILDRLRRVEGLSECVIATTQDASNDVLQTFAEHANIQVFRAVMEDDIAGRLAGAMDMTGADAILKVNADCPLVDPQIMNLLMAHLHEQPDVDYISTKSSHAYPLGLSAEIISSHALHWCDTNLKLPGDREYVCDWISRHPDRFRIGALAHNQPLDHLSLTLDTADDYWQISQIYDALYRPNHCFGVHEILALERRVI